MLSPFLCLPSRQNNKHDYEIRHMAAEGNGKNVIVWDSMQAKLGLKRRQLNSSQCLLMPNISNVLQVISVQNCRSFVGYQHQLTEMTSAETLTQSAAQSVHCGEGPFHTCKTSSQASKCAATGDSNYAIMQAMKK